MGQDTDPDLSAELTKWALSQGASIDGIAAHAFPGRGLGIIAQRKLEPLESFVPGGSSPSPIATFPLIGICSVYDETSREVK
ncbi:hypothetical protein CLCR_04452 [Cladophialophora carrionii]|uniref:Uncharacterized protein n=1 Tax=Cladophialophora carrionii TaxID=86049 RepID=A0A1C1CIP3_9EURO|nr:hypothetical protein CLCR_04452 [Cladophialophora carrionii]